MRLWVVSSLATVLLFTICNGHTVHMGRTCPNVQAFPNLSVDKILGVWFVVYQFDTANTCSLWNLTKSDKGPEQLLLTESRQLYLLDALRINHKQSITANIDIPNPEIPSRMRIRWPTSLTGKADFVVFDTDYENYMAIFQCDRAGIIHRRDVAILSRVPVVDNMFVKRVRRILDSADVKHKHLGEISHRDCKKATPRDWHIDGELFGLIPRKKGNYEELSKGLADYDLSEIEILGDGIESIKGNFRGSVVEGKPSL